MFLLSNGTRIELFDIEDYLNRSQKEFITDYWGRIDDVRYKQQEDAIYNTGSDIEYSLDRHKDKQLKYSYYYSTRISREVMYTP